MCDCHGEAALRGGLAQETPPRAGRPAAGGPGRPLAAVSLAAFPAGAFSASLGRRSPLPLPPPPGPGRAVPSIWCGDGAAGEPWNRCRAGAGRRARAAVPPPSAAHQREPSAGPRARGCAAPEGREAPPRRCLRRASAARRCPLAVFACAASLLPRCMQVGAERCSGRKRRGCGAAGSSAARRQRGPGGTLRGVLWVSFCLLRCALTHLRFS